MTKYRLWTTPQLTIVTGLLGMLAVGQCLPVSAQSSPPPYVPGQVIVALHPSEDVNQIDNDYGSCVVTGISGTNDYALQTPTGVSDASFATRLKNDSRVAHAELNQYTFVSDVNSTQFHYAFDSGPNPDGYENQAAYSMVHEPAGARSSLLGKNVVVAVLDTGITFSHPALAGHIVPGYDAIDPTLTPAEVADGAINDALGHGTMVSGIIAKLSPAAGIMPVRVLNGDGIGTLLDVIDGLTWAQQHGARVINMSFGTPVHSKILDNVLKEIEDTGVVLVAAAGNDGERKADYPAASPGVIATASVESDLTISPYSNYGPDISVAAPGSGIRSTYYTGGYADWSGTSFAAPFVAAQAAIVMGMHPRMEADEVREQITQTAQNVNPYNTLQIKHNLGAGLIDIARSRGDD